MKTKQDILDWYNKKHTHGEGCLCNSCRGARLDVNELEKFLVGLIDSAPSEKISPPAVSSSAMVDLDKHFVFGVNVQCDKVDEWKKQQKEG